VRRKLARIPGNARNLPGKILPPSWIGGQVTQTCPSFHASPIKQKEVV